MAPNDLVDLVDKTLNLVGHDYDAKKKYSFKDIKINKQYALDMPLVPCTKTEIEQVLLNLFINASHALNEKTGDELPQITIRIKQETCNAKIEIEDNGPGIPYKLQSRIFEPFFTTKPMGMGTGLGLSVAYMLVVSNHHGTMEVQSELGKGTTFTIRLPLKIEQTKTM